MLIRIINDRFVSALVGRVLAIEQDSIQVSFTFLMSQNSFTKYDPKTNQCLASRYQYPLRLSYACTIHMSEGMSYYVIDCRHATYPGQLGQAIGRAKRIEL